jgi:ATP-dependent Clp protease ATP-binding subunit ClpA
MSMYPFERFTDDSKRVLTLAQEEAQRSHHSYIGTEHLLLGLLRHEQGLAYKVLTKLGIDLVTVRTTIETVLGRNERIIIQQIIPTSRVKKVIEISFEEARRMGHDHIGTEHLLLGLLVEGEGIAAHVLQDLGATLAKVRDELERVLASGGTERRRPSAVPGAGRLSDEASLAIRLAEAVALSEGQHEISTAHLKRALVSLETSNGNELLRLTAEIRGFEAKKQDAIQRQDFEAAASAREGQQRLRKEFADAEEAWKRSLKPRRKRPPSN